MRNVLPTVLLITTLAACGREIDRRRLLTAEQVATQVVVLDPSRSVAAAALERRCQEAVARAERLLAAHPTTRLDLLIFATGSANSSHEPTVLVPWRSLKLTSGPFEAPEARTVRLRALIEGLGQDCQEALDTLSATDPTLESPIYLALGRGAEALTAHCQDLERGGRQVCGDLRHLAVHSDMRESVHGAMVSRIREARQGRPSLTPVAPIDLLGVKLSICGVSDVAEHGQRDATPVDALTRAWAKPLGLEPRAVFEPSCPVR